MTYELTTAQKAMAANVARDAFKAQSLRDDAEAKFHDRIKAAYAPLDQANLPAEAKDELKAIMRVNYMIGYLKRERGMTAAQAKNEAERIRDMSAKARKSDKVAAAAYSAATSMANHHRVLADLPYERGEHKKGLRPSEIKRYLDDHAAADKAEAENKAALELAEMNEALARDAAENAETDAEKKAHNERAAEYAAEKLALEQAAPALVEAADAAAKQAEPFLPKKRQPKTSANEGAGEQTQAAVNANRPIASRAEMNVYIQETMAALILKVEKEKGRSPDRVHTILERAKGMVDAVFAAELEKAVDVSKK